MTTNPTGAPLWTVTAEFTDRDDAVAFMDLARELGVLTQLNSRSINKELNERPARVWRSGKIALECMQPGRSYDLEHFRGVFQEAGYKPESASPVLTRLVNQGDVERLGDGVYRLAPKPGGIEPVCQHTIGTNCTQRCIDPLQCEEKECIRLRPSVV